MTTTNARTSRAKPMPVEERRASIARATLPLLVAHGRDVTTKQIAEAAGVAEGTLFRVFEDKEAIIDAAVEEFLDPEPFRAALRRIDPTLPLELKIELILDRLLDRFSGIFGVFASLGGRPRPADGRTRRHHRHLRGAARTRPRGAPRPAGRRVPLRPTGRVRFRDAPLRPDHRAGRRSPGQPHRARHRGRRRRAVRECRPSPAEPGASDSEQGAAPC